MISFWRSGLPGWRFTMSRQQRETERTNGIGEKDMSRKGFTLIELLVVIAIIALLMAILMPALGKARDQAKRIHCGGSLKSLAYAGVMYSEDNQGTFPPGHAVPGDLGGGGIYPVWRRSKIPTYAKGFVAHGVLFHAGLIKDPKLYYCPGNSNPDLKYGKYLAPNSGGGWPHGVIPDNVPSSQLWIWSTFHYRSLWTGTEWRALNSSKDSGGTSLLADVFSDPLRGIELHHKIGYNVGYVDAHVEFVKDENRVIEDLNNGNTFHTNYDTQDYVWKMFFDEIRKYPLRDGVEGSVFRKDL